MGVIRTPSPGRRAGGASCRFQARCPSGIGVPVPGRRSSRTAVRSARIAAVEPLLERSQAPFRGSTGLGGGPPSRGPLGAARGIAVGERSRPTSEALWNPTSSQTSSSARSGQLASSSWTAFHARDSVSSGHEGIPLAGQLCDLAGGFASSVGGQSASRSREAQEGRQNRNLPPSGAPGILQRVGGSMWLDLLTQAWRNPWYEETSASPSMMPSMEALQASSRDVVRVAFAQSGDDHEDVGREQGSGAEG